MQARGQADDPPARLPGPAAAPAQHDGPAPHILIVEDEPALLRTLRISFRARGFAVTSAATGREALAAAGRQPPDAVLLDLGLPDTDGLAVIRELRGWSTARIIVLSGRSGSADKIGALDAGADDYVIKPFDMDELLARLRAALRRDARPGDGSRFRIGRAEIDLAAHSAVRHAEADDPAGEDGHDHRQPETVHLTPTEWRLLEILLRSPGQLVSSDRLLQRLWGPGFEDSTHYLRFHMARLRRKLEDDPPRPQHLLTEPGMGYRYQP